MNAAQCEAFGRLLSALEARGYRFTTPTPATHARVTAKKRRAETLCDILGWSLPFSADALEPELFELLRASGALMPRDDAWASAVRVSTLGDLMFLHSAYPTLAPDAVFFGPDSYRFATFLETEMPKLPSCKQLVDVGAGTGVGAIVAARLSGATAITLTDINAAALEFAEINAQHARVGGAATWRFVETNGLADIGGPIDCVIANPPYIADPTHRLYRDGGALHGAAVSLRWAGQAAARLSAGGAFLLYTGSAIINGEDRLKAALLRTLGGFDVTYREIDPDVFSEELERPDYADVDRIAVVGVVAVKPGVRRPPSH